MGVVFGLNSEFWLIKEVSYIYEVYVNYAIEFISVLTGTGMRTGASR